MDGAKDKFVIQKGRQCRQANDQYVDDPIDGQMCGTNDRFVRQEGGKTLYTIYYTLYILRCIII